MDRVLDSEVWQYDRFVLITYIRKLKRKVTSYRVKMEGESIIVDSEKLIFTFSCQIIRKRKQIEDKN